MKTAGQQTRSVSVTFKSSVPQVFLFFSTAASLGDSFDVLLFLFSFVLTPHHQDGGPLACPTTFQILPCWASIAFFVVVFF